VPEANWKMLNTQRRMPHAVGSFISNQFYGGQLGTDTNRSDRDELFASPLAFIDTAELPATERRERHPRHGEPWQGKSWVNDVEATFIADLAAYYDARGSDWVVIVPFSAQEGRISALLGNPPRRRTGANTAV
jgi:superfamily I DNA and/or RNA helicase